MNENWARTKYECFWKRSVYRFRQAQYGESFCSNLPFLKQLLSFRYLAGVLHGNFSFANATKDDYFWPSNRATLILCVVSPLGCKASMWFLFHRSFAGIALQWSHYEGFILFQLQSYMFDKPMFYDGPSRKHCHGVLLGTRDCIRGIKGELNLIGLRFIPHWRPVNLNGVNFSSFAWQSVCLWESSVVCHTCTEWCWWQSEMTFKQQNELLQ